jgi:hypothetical protein
MRLLEAAGHGDAPLNPPRGFQWYGITGRLIDRAADDGTIEEGFAEDYPAYPIQKDLNLMNFDLEGA